MRDGQREIVDLTICRAVFAGWVFAYHVDLHAHFSASLGAGAGLIRRGYLGVDGFFLLSGMILARVHPELAVSAAGAPGFWARRLARIYPVHLAVLLLLGGIVLVGLACGVLPRDAGRFTLPSFLENLLLVQGWGVADQLAWNYPSWSVSTEWAGYLLFPALCPALFRLPAGWAAILLGLCLAGLALVDRRWGGLNLTFAWSLARFFPEFVAGILTTRLLPGLTRPGPALGVAGAVLLLFSLRYAADFAVVAGLWMGLAALLAGAAGGRPGLLPGFRSLRFLGMLSYAFYMSFGTVELFLAQLCRRQGWDPAGHGLIYAACMTLLTFLLALALHRLVEQPARRAIERRLRARPPLAKKMARL